MPNHPLYGPWIDGWKVIPQFPKYEINEFSQVRSKKFQRLISIQSNTFAVLYNNQNKRVKAIVYRLCLLAFFPHIAPSETVDHIIEGDRSNNFVNNLQWLTRSENTRKSNTCQPRHTGTKRSKSIEQWNLEGTSLIATFCSARNASEATNISHGNICHCANGNRPSAGNFVWKWTFTKSQENLNGEVWQTSDRLKELLKTCKKHTQPLTATSISKILVSNCGRIKTAQGIITVGNKVPISPKRREYNGILVHKLVWATFGSREPDYTQGEEICHDDLAPLDEDGCYTNAFATLRIDTHSNNIRESYKYGTMSLLVKRKRND